MMAKKTRRSSLLYLPRICFIVVAFSACLSSAFDPISDTIDRYVSQMRFALSKRSASQEIVFIAIDKHSIDDVGQWPWPRGVYARLLATLESAAPRDIFLDIDFSTPSTQEEDGKLSQALGEVGGVILPVFKQFWKAGDSAQVALTRPITVFADVAWPAFANIELDKTGLVSHFATSDQAENLTIQSVPAALTRYHGEEGRYAIDYSIQPQTVPTVSVADVLSGAVSASMLKDKIVVVGASATELKDIYPVPSHGMIAGPLIHILAAESILQDRLLRDLDPLPLELVLVALVVAAALALRQRSVVTAIASALAFLVCIETFAYWLQVDQKLIFRTGAVWLIAITGLCLFISERFGIDRLLLRRAFADHRVSTSLLQQIISESSDAVIVFDDRLIITEASRSSSPLWSEATALGRSLTDVMPEALAAAVVELASAYLAEPGRTLSRTLQLWLEDGAGTSHYEVSVTLSPRLVYLEDGEADQRSFIGSMIARNDTARRNYENQLIRLSQVDDLTGLLNRREFAIRLDTMPGTLRVAAIGIYRFDVMAKVLGSGRTDDLIVAVADRLSGFSAAGLVGRLGPSSFAVAVSAEQTELDELITSIADCFAEPVVVGAASLHVDVRTGLFETSALREEPAAILRNSEAALESACNVSSQSWRIFDPALAEKQERARALEHEMRDGLQKGEFFLQYQPQVDLSNGVVVGAEALMRWKHATKGLISPGEFIPVAEASGFIRDLGRFALVEACKAASGWPDNLTVAVNLSGIQLQDPALLDDVAAALSQSRLDARRLHLEITESAFVEGTHGILEKIEAMRELGVSIALDDFGTGYSSLSYIGNIPLDKLKIDQSFVRKLSTDPTAAVIIQSVLSLAHGLGLAVIAEGIETEAEWDLLRRLGCEQGQGYYFGRPLTEWDFARLWQVDLQAAAG